MYELAPHVPVIINEPYKRTYYMHFGWGMNGINGLNDL